MTVGGATTSKKKGLSNGSSGSSAGGSGSGAVDEIQFEKAYTDVPHINVNKVIFIFTFSFLSVYLSFHLLIISLSPSFSPNSYTLVMIKKR